MTKAEKRAKIKATRTRQRVNRRVNLDLGFDLKTLIQKLNDEKEINEKLKKELEDTRQKLENTIKQIKSNQYNSGSKYDSNYKASIKTAYNYAAKMRQIIKLAKQAALKGISGPARVYHNIVEQMVIAGVDRNVATSIASPLLSMEPWRVTAIPYIDDKPDAYIYSPSGDGIWEDNISAEEAIKYAEDFINRAAALRRRRYGEYHN